MNNSSPLVSRSVCLGVLIGMFCSDLSLAPSAAPSELQMRVRRRDSQSNAVTNLETINPTKTAIIVVDLWDLGTEHRVEKVIPRMNRTFAAARRLGIKVIHAPAGQAKKFNGQPARENIRRMPHHAPPPPPPWANYLWDGAAHLLQKTSGNTFAVRGREIQYPVYGICVDRRNNTLVHYFVPESGTALRTVESAPLRPAIGKWVHLAVVRDVGKGTLKLYLDGRVSGVTTNIPAEEKPFATDGELLLGSGSPRCLGATFHGAMDEVQLYHRALSDSQVAAVINGAASEVSGWWRFDEGMGADTRDSSASSLHATRREIQGPKQFVQASDENGPQWVSGISGGALKFDGKNDVIEIGSGEPKSPQDIPGDYTWTLWVRFDTPIEQQGYVPQSDPFPPGESDNGIFGFAFRWGTPFYDLTWSTGTNPKNMICNSPRTPDRWDEYPYGFIDGKAHWRGVSPDVIVAPEDFVSDRAQEMWNYFQEAGIENLIYTGSYTNVCVSHRPFGMWNFQHAGLNIFLVRDLSVAIVPVAFDPYAEKPVYDPSITYDQNYEKVLNFITTQGIAGTIDSQDIIRQGNKASRR